MRSLIHKDSRELLHTAASHGSLGVAQALESIPGDLLQQRDVNESVDTGYRSIVGAYIKSRGCNRRSQAWRVATIIAVRVNQPIRRSAEVVVLLYFSGPESRATQYQMYPRPILSWEKRGGLTPIILIAEWQFPTSLCQKVWYRTWERSS